MKRLLLALVLPTTCIVGANLAEGVELMSESVRANLAEGVELMSESVHEGKWKEYRVQSLEPNAVYEVKVSFLSTEGVHFQIEDMKQRPRRLNTAKMIWTGKSNGRIALRAMCESRGCVKGKNILYNIVVERQLMGLLPKSALLMVVWGVFMCVVAKHFLGPWIRRLFLNL